MNIVDLRMKSNSVKDYLKRYESNTEEEKKKKKKRSRRRKVNYKLLAYESWMKIPCGRNP